MVPPAPALLLLLSLASQLAAGELCRGSLCGGHPSPGAGAGAGAAARVAAAQHHAHSPGGASETHASAQPFRGGARPRAHRARPAGCAHVDCGAPPKPSNDSRECRGMECRLPPGRRPEHRDGTCAGGGCAAAPELSGSSPPPLVHLSDRAAQFLGDFPDPGHPAPEVGGAPLGVQLTCDVTPGENDPSEDALILHLQLAEGQEQLVEALRAQQGLIRELQQKLVEQQEALLSQQKAILGQQRRMAEQMDALKAQFGPRGLQGALHSCLQGQQIQARGHLHKSSSVDGAHAAPALMDVMGEALVPPPLRGCSAPCGQEEYCNVQKAPPGCQRCTVCPPGFFPVSQCSATADSTCQDRDECEEPPRRCGEQVKCLNTPGGFRCLGESEREAARGLCGHGYFYNQELRECRACSDCGGEPVSAPCTATGDAACGSASSESRLSLAWAAHVAVPSAKASGTHVFPGIQLNIRGTESGEFLSVEAGRLTFRQHGLVWLDHNFAVQHSCRNFLQLGMRLNGSQEDEGRELAAVRIEQPDRKYFQGVSVSTGVEVEPNHTLALVLRSPNQHCNQSRDLQVYEVAAPSLSLLWLSHDTGAVTMTAQISPLAHYQTSYRPTLRTAWVSDPYMITLSHDNRAVRFTEGGAVKFVLQQALYAAGPACVRHGFSLVAYTTARNGTGREAARAFKAGVNYRDTSITLSGTVGVAGGDALGFQITSPPQCGVRYFGDGGGVSTLSLIWIPSAASSCLTATVSRTSLPSGAVRNKPLSFQQVGPEVRQVHLARSGESHGRKEFIFRESGTASVALDLKLIHSCSLVMLTLQQVGGRGAAPLAQQASGSMPEGSQWAGVALRASFGVRNGTAVFVTLDCVRGRVNQVAHEGSAHISILWVAM